MPSDREGVNKIPRLDSVAHSSGMMLSQPIQVILTTNRSTHPAEEWEGFGMPPLKFGDQLINLSQVAYINLNFHKDGDARIGIRFVFGPQQFSALYGDAAKKFGASEKVATWSRYSTLSVGDYRINMEQVTYCDLKYTSRVLVPPGVKDAVHVAFASGCELHLFDADAVQFRTAWKQYKPEQP